MARRRRSSQSCRRCNSSVPCSVVSATAAHSRTRRRLRVHIRRGDVSHENLARHGRAQRLCRKFQQAVAEFSVFCPRVLPKPQHQLDEQLGLECAGKSERWSAVTCRWSPRLRVLSPFDVELRRSRTDQFELQRSADPRRRISGQDLDLQVSGCLPWVQSHLATPLLSE